VVIPKVSATARREFYDFTQRDRIVSAALEQPRADLALVKLLGFHAGLRRAEIDHARPEWLDLSRRVIHVRNLPPAEATRLTLAAAKISRHGVFSPRHRQSLIRFNLSGLISRRLGRVV
jgi:hypothetical protein